MIIVQNQSRASHGGRGKGWGKTVNKAAPLPRWAVGAPACPHLGHPPAWCDLGTVPADQGGAVCFPKQCLALCQEAQHPTGITGGSDGLSAQFPAEADLEGGSLARTSGDGYGGGEPFSPFLGGCNCSTTLPPNYSVPILGGSHSQERTANP